MESNSINSNNDKLYYFSKSADKYPGKGINEKISDDKVYHELSKTKNWRKILSNFYVSPFVLDGHNWQTVEHYYQGMKFIGAFRDQFSLDSKSNICELPEMAKAAGGKTGKFKGIKIRPDEITCDIDEFNKNKNEIMFKAMMAKFSQNKEISKVLINTQNAELWHSTRGIVAHRVFILEKVRDLLAKNQRLNLSES